MKSCKGPKSSTPAGDTCPKCGRADFTSKPGRTLHIKACKGSESIQLLETPCPICGEYLNSLSGRTLHIKSCEEKAKQEIKSKKTKKPTKTESPQNHICPYCDKEIFGYEKTIANHQDKCYPLERNKEGHFLDKHLNVWVKRAPARCYAEKSMSSVLSCNGIPRHGIFFLNHYDARPQTGCWLEATGQCIYTFDAKTRKHAWNNTKLRVHGEMTSDKAPSPPKTSLLRNISNEPTTDISGDRDTSDGELASDETE